MRLAALTSGGKDSILSIQKCLEAGDEVSYMVTVIPDNHESYMFHSANLAAVPVMAERAGMEYVAVPSAGKKEEEIVDLKKEVAKLPVDGIVAGAIASEYQRTRVDAVCRELGLKMTAPLWGMNPLSVMKDVSRLLDARIVVTAADGLGENVLGKKIDDALIRVLCSIEAKRRIHIAGEGGEYESLVFNAPFFSSPVRAADMHVEIRGMRGMVSYGRFW